MRFSIIVPVYKAEKYLADCIDSILGQTFTDHELILVDDGSPDNCPEICDQYCKKDGRVKVIHKENGGSSSARNAGLDIVKGEYIVFVDSDDRFNSCEALMTLDKLITDNNTPELLMSNTWGYPVEYKDGNDLLIFLINMGFKEKRFSQTPWDKVYRADYIAEHNIRFEEGYTQEDILWSFEVIADARSIAIMDEFFIERTINCDSVTRSVSDEAVFKRAASKLNITKIGADRFKNGNYSNALKGKVYEFCIGIYNSGIKEGLAIKDKSYMPELYSEINKTKDIYKLGYNTSNKKYRFLSVIYRLMGVKPIIRYICR